MLSRHHLGTGLQDNACHTHCFVALFGKRRLSPIPRRTGAELEKGGWIFAARVGEEGLAEEADSVEEPSFRDFHEETPAGGRGLSDVSCNGTSSGDPRAPPVKGWQDLPKGVQKEHLTPARVPSAAHAGPADGLCGKTP